jgi:very-short-patch-repair endonuclease
VVEVDGVRFHRDRKRMERDNKRQDYLRHRDQAVTRFTGRQVMYEPEYVLFRTGLEVGRAMARTASRK